ncbi:MAG: tyrosine-type recombinase/integrase [Akkermansiaceae bacterium]|nr:tyrosine-type recombinase/integrase [Akkermansiaceae bacterium]
MSGHSGISNLIGMRGRKKGGLPSVPAGTYPDPTTLPARAAAFLEHLAMRSYSLASIDAHRWAFTGFLDWARTQGHHSPTDFTRSILESYQLHLHNYCSPRTGKPLVVNTQIARLGCIRRLFAWLCRTGAIPANPAADLDLPRKQTRQLPKSLSPEEIDRLLARPNTTDPFGLRDRTILELFYATGIRRTEMTNLDHGDYDTTARTLLIRRGKGGKSRLLPVGERAAVWLDRYLAESRPQFAHLPSETSMFLSGYGTRITPAYLGTWVAGQMKLAGITTKGSCHLFRHSCATAMHIGGADIRYVQEMLGHSRMETTQIYTHVHIAALAEVHARCHPHGRMPSIERVPGAESPEEPAEESSPGKDSPSHPLPNSLVKNREMLEVCPSKQPALARPSNRPGNSSDDDLDPPSSPAPAKPAPSPPPSGKPSKNYSPNHLGGLSTSTRHDHLNYYGYRYYDANVGRWINRDPVGERGGMNLYGFIKNMPTMAFDVLGYQIRFPETPPINDKPVDLPELPIDPDALPDIPDFEEDPDGVLYPDKPKPEPSQEGNGKGRYVCRRIDRWEDGRRPRSASWKASSIQRYHNNSRCPDCHDMISARCTYDCRLATSQNGRPPDATIIKLNIEYCILEGAKKDLDGYMEYTCPKTIGINLHIHGEHGWDSPDLDPIQNPDPDGSPFVTEIYPNVLDHLNLK